MTANEIAIGLITGYLIFPTDLTAQAKFIKLVERIRAGFPA